ncbi:MAG: VWA domain-containing protein [Phycisphaeraceae bacterium]|nr:VWA domain-containing protein [Phycisphaeraceae bacterium]
MGPVLVDQLQRDDAKEMIRSRRRISGEREEVAAKLSTTPQPTSVVAGPASEKSVLLGRASGLVAMDYRGDKDRMNKPVAFNNERPAIALGLERKSLSDVESEVHATHPGFHTEGYDRIVDNAFLRVLDHPLSTFSIDVDTASYANIRRFIMEQNQLPPKDAVRIEEMINYFTYDYSGPADDKTPFASHVEISGCPWNDEHRLVRIGLKGREMAKESRPASNLVFLIDVSGSMQPANKLPLLKQGLRLLVDQLDERDRVALVVYAGASGLVLDSTPVTDRHVIETAIDKLQSGGSTNGAAGIELAYQVATQHIVQGGTNRVILCTDGDFNVGVTDRGSLTRLIEDKRKSGVFLSVLGFGMGNLKDATMEQLADKGNGNYAYIDTLDEARKVLVDQMLGTLVTIAKDVKIQVEFNPATVQSYRLIGYENRLLAKEDFNDDTKDAGEIGAGHTVTALYEVVPVGVKSPTTTPAVDALKYQLVPMDISRLANPEMLTLKLRYKQPDGDVSSLLEFPVKDAGKPLAQSSDDFRFAVAMAGFGMILRDSPHKGSATCANMMDLAQGAMGQDAHGYRKQFIEMVGKARTLMNDQRPESE